MIYLDLAMPMEEREELVRAAFPVASVWWAKYKRYQSIVVVNCGWTVEVVTTNIRKDWSTVEGFRLWDKPPCYSFAGEVNRLNNCLFRRIMNGHKSVDKLLGWK